MPRHFTASLHPDSAAAIAQNTDHVITGYYFFRWLKGVQVGDKLIPLKVVLDGDYSKRQGCEGKIIRVSDQGFFDEADQPFDIWTINLVLGDAGFKFGVRFKFETKTDTGIRMYVN